MQCREFLGQHPGIKVVEGEDTARSAEIIQQEHLKGHAAICSKAAAERYGMKSCSKVSKPTNITSPVSWS